MKNDLAKIAKQISGKSIKILSNRSSHGYIVGSTVPVTTAAPSTNGTVRINNIWSLYPDEFSYGPVTRKDIQEQVDSLNKEISVLKGYLEFLDETGLETYDETEVKVYQTLKVLKQSGSDLEKTKLIAALIKD